MHTNPAFHPHTLDDYPETALAPQRKGLAGAMGENQVMSVEPLSIVPCSAEFDREELREYGGVEAGFLAWAAPELLRRKWDIGIGAIHHALWKFSTKVQNALFTYSRVKRAMRWLETPQKVSVFIDDLPAPETHAHKQVEPASRLSFMWDVTPKDVYRWEACKTRYGFDPRGTSLNWIERQVRDARAKARSKAVREFKAREGIATSSANNRTQNQTGETIKVEIKTFEPASAQFGEIWPPVPVPGIADAPVTVTPDYASEHEARIKADPDEAVIGVVYIEDETNRDSFRNDQTWWLLTGQYDVTDTGVVYAPDAELKPP